MERASHGKPRDISRPCAHSAIFYCLSYARVAVADGAYRGAVYCSDHHMACPSMLHARAGPRQAWPRAWAVAGCWSVAERSAAGPGVSIRNLYRMRTATPAHARVRFRYVIGYV